MSVIMYGAFNPPHQGHDKLYENAKRLANKKDCRLFIATNNVQDKKNPLSFHAKVMFLEQMFPDHPIIELDNSDGIFGALVKLRSLGVTTASLVVGEDRFSKFKSINEEYDLAKYSGLNSVEIVHGGPRHPLISSTEMIRFAKECRMDEFFAMTSHKLDKHAKQLLYSLVKETRD